MEMLFAAEKGKNAFGRLPNPTIPVAAVQTKASSKPPLLIQTPVTTLPSPETLRAAENGFNEPGAVPSPTIPVVGVQMKASSKPNGLLRTPTTVVPSDDTPVAL